MGQTADELRQEIDQSRDNASQKIDQIEQMVTGAADQVKEQVTQTKEQIKQTLDWRHQVEENPLVALGAAFIGGIVLGGITGGGDGDSQQHQDDGQPARGDGSGQYSPSYGQTTGYRQDDDGLMGAVRAAARKTGLEETVANMADGLMATLGDRIKQIADDAFPGLADHLRTSSSATSSPRTGLPAMGATSWASDAGTEQSGYGQSGAYGATHASSGGASFS